MLGVGGLCTCLLSAWFVYGGLPLHSEVVTESAKKIYSVGYREIILRAEVRLLF